MSGRTYRNGKLIDGDCLDERAFVYADGVFETMRAREDHIPLWCFHRERLKCAAERLGLPICFETLEAQLEQALSVNRESHQIVKLIIGRAGEARGSYLPKASSVNSFILLKHFAPSEQRSGVDLVTTRSELLDRSDFAGLKLINRLPYIVAASKVNVAKGSELLFLNSAAQVLESMHHNIFVLKDRKLYTPDLINFGVKGVMRECIIERLAPSLSLNVRMRELSLEDLYGADAVFLTNAVEGIVPVASIDGKSLKLNTLLSPLQGALARYYQ